jgi:hypothetical protein
MRLNANMAFLDLGVVFFIVYRYSLIKCSTKTAAQLYVNAPLEQRISSSE